VHVDFDLSRATGVSRYGMELARRLDAMGHLRELWVPRDAAVGAAVLAGVSAEVRRFPFPRRATEWAWPLMWRKAASLDAVISPAGRVLPPAAGPQAAMVHDMGPFVAPELKAPDDARAWRRRIGRTVRRARMVAVNSRHTLQTLLERFPGASSRTAVTPLGIDHFRRSEPSGRAAHILSVGTLEPRKNYRRLIEAYAELCSRDPDVPPLVIAGKDGYRSAEVRSAPDALGIASRVRFPGYVPEEGLRRLYADAACLVHPALQEGFGFTVAEAFAWGLPVAAASGSATEEYFRGAVDLFDPGSVPSIRNAVAGCLRSGVTPEQLARRDELFGELTWERCAALTVEALETVL
jgi:glycosyltransferase involved in cell wall biosynthesis